MLAVTRPVEAALAKRCDAWHLRLDKFSFKREAGATAKTDALKQVLASYNRSRGLLAKACEARLRLLDGLKNQRGDRFGCVELVAESRLLLHLGRASVLENVGLYCDRTTGLPLIPGTALKGVLSTWACWTEHFNPADGSFRAMGRDGTQRRNFTAQEARLAGRILGDDSPTGSEHAGDVVFLGGFPLTPPTLGLDIVNPHHDAEGKSIDPKPNTFLCLEPGTMWRFAFYVRAGATDVAELVTTTKRWIEEALTQLGIGAKTAAGYGRFRRPSDANRAALDLEAQNAKAAEAIAAKLAGVAAEIAKERAEAEAILKSDYPNEATFKNRVLAKLNPGQLGQLEAEVEYLKKPENAAWLQKLKTQLASKDYKGIRKRLASKDWFPKDWLPSP